MVGTTYNTYPEGVSMIAYLKGIVKDIENESLILLVNGVGYEVFAPAMTLNELEGERNQIIELWIHTHVREDAFILYGFLNKSEKEFFLNLLKINGVGPKSALHVLGGAPMDQIFEMIENEDVKGLSKLPKVGKKTAEQMILSLKGKLVRLDKDADSKELKLKNSKISKWSGTLNVIASALTNLGYRPQDVELVVSQLPQDISEQEGIRKSLQILSGEIRKEASL